MDAYFDFASIRVYTDEYQDEEWENWALSIRIFRYLKQEFLIDFFWVFTQLYLPTGYFVSDVMPPVVFGLFGKAKAVQ